MYASATVIPWLQTEQLLDGGRFSLACRYVEADADASASISTMLDAIFSACHSDRRQAILLAAIACEGLFAEQTEEAVRMGLATAKTARDARKIRDFRNRVSDGALMVFGRSFAADAPLAHEKLSKLWIARHALAHGAPAQIQRLPALTDVDEFAEVMLGAYGFVHWLATLWPRAFPDLLALYSTPLVRVA